MGPNNFTDYVHFMHKLCQLTACISICIITLSRVQTREQRAASLACSAAPSALVALEMVANGSWARRERPSSRVSIIFVTFRRTLFGSESIHSKTYILVHSLITTKYLEHERPQQNKSFPRAKDERSSALRAIRTDEPSPFDVSDTCFPCKKGGVAWLDLITFFQILEGVLFEKLLLEGGTWFGQI